MSKPQLTFDDFVRLKLATRSLIADRILPELLTTAAQNQDPTFKAAADVLTRWDHTYENKAGERCSLKHGL